MTPALHRSARASVAVLIACAGLLGALLTTNALANAAGARPDFQLPFPCGEVWYGSTRVGHKAVDFNLLTEDGGKPVVASATGTAEPGEETGWGSYVLVDHGGGWWTIYAHLLPAGRASGPVAAGDVIGFVGSTGNSSGNHLHWEQWKDVVKQPTLYVDNAALNVAEGWPGTALESRNCPDSAPTTSPTATTVAPTTVPPTTVPPTTVPPTTVTPVTVPATTVPPAPFVDGFVAAAPRRLLDTRAGTKLGARSTTVVTLDGIPTDIEAVLVGLTTVNADQSSFLTAYRCGTPRPSTTSVSSRAGANTAGLVVVQPDALGRVCIYSHGSTDLIVDLAGWLPAATGYASMTATRFVDTRTTGSQLRPWDVLRIQASRQGDEAAAIVVTAVDAATSGYITVWPCDAARPLTSNLNFVAGAATSNLTVSGLDPQGGLCISASTATHLIVDPGGAFAAHGALHSTAPTRLTDTRTGLGIAPAPGSVSRIGTAGIVPSGADSAVVNLTVTMASSAGYVTVFPCGQRPATSNLNFEAGTTIANLVVSGLDATGELCVFTSARAHLVVDLAGWFEPVAGT